MYNAVTNKEYTGKNLEILMGFVWEFESRGYATFKQWKSIGRVPKQGSKGIKLKWFKEVMNMEGKKSHQLQYFTVFNFDQTIALESLNNKETKVNE